MTPPSRVTLVLSGGGAKASADLGAARAMAEAGLVPTRYVGTSMGAVMGALLAAGLTPAEAQARLESGGGSSIGRPALGSLLRGVFARSVLRGDQVLEFLDHLLPVRSFGELKVPLTVTTVDLDSGALLLLGDGGLDLPLATALAASCALPIYFPPVEINGRRYGDGGLRAVLPLEVAAAWPADLVVAVDTGSGYDEAAAPGPRAPALLAAHDDATRILMAEQTRSALAIWRATPGRPRLVYVRPPVERGATFRADQIRRYAEAGYVAARAALALT
ncbi:MAG: patatin-like phospholipase family protein [Gemmatimonadales bacterium]